MRPKYTYYSAIVIATLIAFFYINRPGPQISEDVLQKIEENLSTSQLQKEKRQLVNNMLFQQTGMALVLMFIPLLFVVFQNRTLQKRLKKRWYKSKVKSLSQDEPKSFESRLLSLHPAITKNELKICSMLRKNFTSKEIAIQLNVMPSSVNTARYRLRKKLQLKEQDLIHYLHQF